MANTNQTREPSLQDAAIKYHESIDDPIMCFVDPEDGVLKKLDEWQEKSPFPEDDLIAIQAVYDVMLAEYQSTLYQSQRAAEYPPIEDYIDGVVKGDQAQIDQYIADCIAVKEKYPKPSA